MATLSLCLIVRDEAELLPQFLAGVRGAYDELIAVDTGSRDATRDLLVEAGAKVIDFVWQDDFSAARNACVQAATGDYLLMLDADEMAQEGFAGEVRNLLKDENLGAATVRIQSELKHGHIRESDLLRLFRRDFNVTYRFRIHEEVATEVELALMMSGRSLRHLATPVKHLGYSMEMCVAKEKKARDIKLLNACVQEDPNDLYSWFKLLEQGRFYADAELTQRAARGALPALEHVGDVHQHGHFLPDLVVLLVEALTPLEPRTAEALLMRYAGLMPQSAALLHARGQFYEVRGRVHEAALDFSACLQLKAANRQLTTVRPRLGLARLALAQRDIMAAREHVTASLALCPNDPEALLAEQFLIALEQPPSSPAAART